MAKSITKSESKNLTMAQEAELNSKAASKEGFEHKLAFETYYKTGEKRSLKAIAQKLNKGLSTVEEWSKKYRWVARVKERERQAAEYILMQQSAKEEAEVKQKHLTLVDASIGQWSKKLVDGTIKLTSVDDLQKLVNLRWQLAQMPDKLVNKAIAAQGATIDLRLRNMDKKELQSFLYGTLKSIQRVMSKPSVGDKSSKAGEKMSLDIRLERHDEAPPNSDFDIIEIESTETEDFDFDLDNLDID